MSQGQASVGIAGDPSAGKARMFRRWVAGQRIPTPSKRLQYSLLAVWAVLLLVCLWGIIGGFIHLAGLPAGNVDGRSLAFHAGGLVYLFAAALLVRRFDDPAAIILSFALLLLPSWSPIGHEFWVKQELTPLSHILRISALALLACSTAVFPDGRFIPGWSRIIFVGAPLAAGLVLVTTSLRWSLFIQVPAFLLCLVFFVAGPAALFIRSRRRLGFEQRQQLKWAAYGLVLGVGLLAFGIGLAIAGGQSVLGVDLELLGIIGSLMIFAGFGLIPLGCIASVSRFRLNDPDAMLSIVSGSSIAAMAFGIVWVVVTAVLNDGVRGFFLEHEVTGQLISAALSLQVFAPVKDRSLRFMESRLQPALVELRSLPGEILDRGHDEDPGELARETLGAIVKGVHASWAALIVRDPCPIVVDALNVPRDQVSALAEGDAAAALAWGAASFSLTLTKCGKDVGLLLLGPRTDHATYRRTERKALEALAGLLGCALFVTHRRAGRHGAMTAQLMALETAVRQFGASVPAPASPAPATIEILPNPPTDP